MKKIILLIPLLLCLWTFGQTPANDPHWEFVWEDNFNFFDNNRWVKTHYCDHGREPQLYLDNNVWTSNGNLGIRENKTPVNCPQNPPLPTTWA